MVTPGLSPEFGYGREYIGLQKQRYLQIASALYAEIQRYSGKRNPGVVAVTADNIVEELIEI